MKCIGEKTHRGYNQDYYIVDDTNIDNTLILP